MSFVLTEQEPIEIIDEGTWLEAEVIGCKINEMPWKDEDGNPDKKIQFTFRVTQDGRYFGRRLTGQTPAWFTTSPRCKFRQWVTACFATEELPDGFALELEDLLDTVVEVEIGVKPVTPKDGSEAYHLNFVKNVRASGGGTGGVVVDDEPF